MRTTLLILLAAALILAAGCSSQRPAVTPPHQLGPPSGSATPTLAATETLLPSNIPSLPPPGSWAAEINNPWFPLIPGTTRIFNGLKDGERTVETYVVTGKTKKILGAPATVIRDTLRTKNGRLLEDTEDWYAQDLQGTVWYLGEATRTYKADGKSIESTEGSWEAGVDGAIAGVFMRPRPAIGYRQFQEYYAGHAEDQYAVVGIDATVSVPYGVFSGAVLTEETTMLEPSVVSNKYYVRGVGEVYEVDVKGSDEYNKLVAVKK